MRNLGEPMRRLEHDNASRELIMRVLAPDMKILYALPTRNILMAFKSTIEKCEDTGRMQL